MKKQPMKPVQENISLLSDKVAEVKAHCLCFSFVENSTCFAVLLPAGYGVDLIRAHFSRELSKVECLDRILNKLESIWKNSFPGAKIAP